MAPQNDTPWWDTDQPRHEDTPWWDHTDTDEAAPTTTQTTWWDDQTTAHQQVPHPEPWQLAWRWLHNNLHTVVYTLIGLGVAIGILQFGFWKTLLVALCLGIGYILGSWHDGNPQLVKRIKRFTKRWIENNPFMK